MTNANDLLWWDTDDGGCKLVYGDYSLCAYHDGGWAWMRQFASGVWHMGDVLHWTREAAMQAAVDAAEAAGVDFSKAPRWTDGKAVFLPARAWTAPNGKWVVVTDRSDGNTLHVIRTAPTESLARTAAIAALRREVQKMIDTAKGELGV